MTKPDTWRIDLERSNLRFLLRHIIVHQIRGRFRAWGGEVLLDDDLSRSSVRVWVNLGSVDTEELERDEQVRSPEFFDVARFPRATFTSTAVRLPERANPIVVGRLDLHGVIGDVELEIVRHNRWSDDQGLERVSYEVKAQIDRRAFGLRWNQDLDVGGVVVGDEIEILATLEAVRVGPKS